MSTVSTAINAFTGHFNAAIIHLNHVLTIAPNHGEARCELALCQNAKVTAEDLAAIKATFDSHDLPLIQRVSAAFGLAKRLDDDGRYDEAFDYYAAANRLFKDDWSARDRTFDRKKFGHFVDQIRAQ